MLAAVAALVLLGQGLDAVLVTHGNGAGAPFNLATAALLATAYFARRLVRQRRRPARSFG